MIQFSIINNDGEKNITVFIPGHDPLVAHESHPNFEAIVEGALADDDSIVDLFDVSLTVGEYLEPLTERVSVANGRVYFDGDEVNNALTKQIIRFLREGVSDWVPLVNFFEKVQQNPLEHSREQLYKFLRANEFTITADGDIVAYKGVRLDKETGIFESLHTGTAIVDGEVHRGHIPNPIGSVVTMPRNEVAHDPEVGCSTGLHVATHTYAQSYGTNGAVLEVHVNPRDVVSVPHDSAEAEKVRVCRYEVVAVRDQPHEDAVIFDEYDEDYDDYDCECDGSCDNCDCGAEW